MKIVLTGGGTGGHLVPLVTVAEKIKEKVPDAQFIFMGPAGKLERDIMGAANIPIRQILSGKKRRYFSLQNFVDVFKIPIGITQSLFWLLIAMPDAIFSKGGYAIFPVLLAARILGIPVVIHESDAVPGRVNLWSGKFAKHVAVSYDEAGVFFPPKKVAVTGQPIRQEILEKKTEGTFEYLQLDSSMPTILVLGGSLGAEAINNIIIDSLLLLLPKYQIIHQTGVNNFEDVKKRTDFILNGKPDLQNRYRPFPFLNMLALKMAAGASSLVISRAGSALFEIAAWGIPSILIPIDKSHNDHQKKNAFNYARHGGAEVIEEGNLSPTILLSEIKRFYDNDVRRRNMIASAKAFATPEASDKIARMLVDMAIAHEK